MTATNANVELPEELQNDEAIGQYVTFMVDEQSFAFPMTSVLEIIRVPQTVEVPLTPGALRGLANLRGTVLPVLDLRQILGLEDVEYSDATRVVVADIGMPVGLVVDRVARVLNVEPDRIEDATGIQSTIDAELLNGVVKESEGQNLIQLLDVEKVVGQEFSTVLDGISNVDSAVGGNVSRSDESSNDGEDDTLQLVSFVVDEQEYAFDIIEVEEIVRVPEEISQVPRSQSHVLGLMDLRGRLLPLVNLRRMFMLHEAPLEDRNRILVISLSGTKGQSVGIVVDQVREVLRVPKEVQDRMPALLSQGDGMDEIGAVCRLDDGKRLVSVLSSGALFQDPAVQTALESAIDEEDENMALEAVDSVEGSDDDVTQLVVFSLGEEEYGVLIEAVQEITRVPTEMSKVPKTPEFIEGMVNLRGTVLPVVDMRARFGLERIERNDRQRILVLNLEGIRTGFIMDSVTEVLRLSRNVIEDSPHLSKDQARVMGRVANLKESKRMIQVLDVGELLDEQERRRLREGH